MMLRLFDLLFSVTGLFLSTPALLIIYMLCLFDSGAPLLLQERIGRYKKPFIMLKFRTMRPNTVFVASHLVDSSAITPLGAFLRHTKLDELPQLWNVIKGEMSLVGPRPCLSNQTELIKERDSLSVYDARPGITGLAQLYKIDMSSVKLLAETDARMLRELTSKSYLKYIFMTVIGRGAGDAKKSS